MVTSLEPAAGATIENEVARLAALERETRQIVSERAGQYGIAVTNLDSGAGFSVNGDTIFNTASVIKVPIMVEIYRQAAAGAFRLDDPIEMRAVDQVGGSGLIYLFKAGLNLTVRDAVVAMIVISDNTATNMCIERAGIDPINATMRELGLTQTVCRRKLSFATPDDITREPIGVTTPNEMNRLNGLIADGKVVDRAACDDMLDIMAQQQHTTLFPRYIPRKSDPANGNRKTPRICHKTGGTAGVRNDSGILYVPNGPRLAFSAFSMDVPDMSWTPENEALLTIGRIGKLVYDAYAQPLADKVGVLA